MPRARCLRCQRPLATCLCDWIHSIDNLHPVAILQHPTEAKQALGTARIARLSLKRCELWQGEDFHLDEAVQTWLKRHQSNCYVIFPGINAKPLTNVIGEGATEQSLTADAAFIFIDGTWNKAKKIWHLNHWLHNLPQLTLQPTETSHYRIRKSPFKESLSTVEAIALTMGTIENNKRKYQPLLDVFDNMIDSQIEFMGNENYRRHYSR